MGGRVRVPILYAVRRLGRDGWCLRVKEEVRDRVEDWADEPGDQVLEVRRVTTYGVPEEEAGSVSEGDAVFCGMSASWAGWRFDKDRREIRLLPTLPQAGSDPKRLPLAAPRPVRGAQTPG